jgi:hypothetical protein
MAKWYAATEVNGGGDDTLEMVPNPGDYTDLVTGDKAFVMINNLNTRIYEYDEDLADAEDFFGIITIPNGNVSGTGAWKEKRITGLMSFWAGTIANHFDALVTEAGGVVSVDFEGTGSIPGLGIWSDDLIAIPIQSVTLDHGSDVAPTANFIYILRSDPTVLVANSEWPVDEHIKVTYCLVPSAAHVAAEGAYINHNWNEGNELSGMGHLSSMGENIRLTQDGAHWHVGCAGNGATDDYITIVTDDTPDSAYFVTAAGVCFQMHRHTVPAFNSQTDHMHIVNAYGEAYKAANDIRDETVDSANGSLNNKYYNVVFWQVANKSGEAAPVMMNMPSGSYTGLNNAINDVDGYDVYDIPRQFKEDSSTGFLICRITFRQTSSAITVHNTTDLRGRTPGTASGTSLVAGTEFADNQFKLYNVLDITKICDMDLSNITTGNIRTIEIPDADMVIPTGTVAGATVLNFAGSPKFETTTAGVKLLDTQPVFGIWSDFDHADNRNFVIYNDAFGSLWFKKSNDKWGDPVAQGHPVLKLSVTGAVELHFAGAKKLETVAEGSFSTGYSMGSLGLLVGADDTTTDGAWRIIESGTDLVVQKRESGSWNIKLTIED